MDTIVRMLLLAVLALTVPASAAAQKVKILGKTAAEKKQEKALEKEGQQEAKEAKKQAKALEKEGQQEAKADKQGEPADGDDESVSGDDEAVSGDVKYIGTTADKYNYATPDAVGQPGPFPANTDFYFVSSTGTKGVSFVAGDPTLLKQPGLLELYFDVSRVQFGKENWLEDYRKIDDPSEVEEILSRATGFFRVEFNRKNKSGTHIVKARETVDDAPYILVVRLRKLNKGNATDFWFGSSAKAGGATIDGTVELLDAKTHEVYAVYGFNDIEGGNHATKKTRVGLAFYELARQMGKLVRGPKKKKGK